MTHKPKLFIKTFGCQMNVNDSEYIIGQLLKLGYSTTEDISKSNLILLNTCCVRAKVEQKIFSLIGKIKKIKESNPDVILGICGCMAQKEKENIFESAPHVDFIFNPSQINNLENIINNLVKYGGGKYISCDDTPEFSLNHIPVKRESKISAWIQIMRGCNNYCSYCVVPYTRGPEQSRGASEILSEAADLAHDKYKEIFLLGQNVNSYGNDLSQPVTFSELLELLNNIKGIERIRFTTSHPKDFSFNLIKTIKSSDKVCNHIHLPVQSGSSKILKAMNRKYDIDYYKNIIKEIRNNIDDIAITTDVMVGFPGETEKDFADTLNNLMKRTPSFIQIGKTLLLPCCLARFPYRSKKKGYGNLLIYKKKYQLKLIKNLKGKYLRSWWIKSLKEILKINFPGGQGPIKP